MKILEIKSLSEIPNNQPVGTVYFFDLDDTLIDYPHMLGSKAWRSYLAKTTDGYEQPGSHHDIFTLSVVENHPIGTVEAITKKWLKTLQATGYAVYGLTARERNIWFYTPRERVDVLTCAQLAYAGIDFDQNPQSDLHLHFTQSQEYFKGIFFCNLDSKGDYVKKLLGGRCPKPQKIIFVDDKREHVEGVSKALAELKIDYECYWYCGVDEKTRGFEPLVANIQLHYFMLSKGHCVLSDDDARLIAKKNPEKEALLYLQAAQQTILNAQEVPEKTNTPTRNDTKTLVT